MRAFQERLRRPGLAWRLEHGRIRMVAREANVVAGPARLQLAAVQLKQGAGEADNRQVLRLAGVTGGGGEARLRLREPAEVEGCVAAVVERGRRLGFEPHSLVEEGVGHPAVAGLVDDHTEGGPQPPVMRMGQDGLAQDLDRIAASAEIGQGAGAPVDRLQPSWSQHGHLLPQGERLFGHVEPAGDPRQSGQKVHVSRCLRQGGLIGPERLAQLAGGLAPAGPVGRRFGDGLRGVCPVAHGAPRRRP